MIRGTVRSTQAQGMGSKFVHEIRKGLPYGRRFNIRHQTHIVVDAYVPIGPKRNHIGVIVIIDIALCKCSTALLIHYRLTARFSVAAQLGTRLKLRSSVNEWTLAHSKCQIGDALPCRIITVGIELSLIADAKFFIEQGALSRYPDDVPIKAIGRIHVVVRTEVKTLQHTNLLQCPGSIRTVNHFRLNIIIEVKIDGAIAPTPW